MGIEVDSDGETVMLVTDKADGVEKLSTRDAFDLVTDLLAAIDRARAYGEVQRREVPQPRDRHGNEMLGGPKNYPRTNAQKAREARRARPSE